MTLNSTQRKWNHRTEAWFLALASLLFLSTRLWNVSLFPIFNDETIYLQYSELIHDDFSANKYVSVHNIYADWKPPLQYWIGGLFINSKRDPVVAGRIVASVFSLIGLFGTYFFVRQIFNPTAAAGAAAFYLISPLTLFYNTQFVAETFVFSATSALYACLAALLRSLEKSRITALMWFMASALAGALLVLFKQAGALPLYLSIVLPFAFRTSWRAVAKGAAVVAAVILLSSILSSLAIPAQYSTNEAQYTAQWTMSVKEIASLPAAVWSANAKEILELYARSYTFVMLAAILLYAVWSFVRGTSNDLTVLALFLLSSAAIIFCLKQFNEYLYHTAVVVFMLAILGRLASLTIEDPGKLGIHRRIIVILPGILLLFIGVFWIYQCVLIKTDSVAYLRQASTWAKENYLNGWPSGYGVKDVAQFLSSRAGTGLVILDPQWGNPRTSLEILRPLAYPNMRLFRMGDDILQKESLLKRMDNAGIRENRFIIFSDWSPPGSVRDRWVPYVKANYCVNKRQFSDHPDQIPIVVCEF